MKVIADLSPSFSEAIFTKARCDVNHLHVDYIVSVVVVELLDKTASMGTTVLALSVKAGRLHRRPRWVPTRRLIPP
jgi:hypothetical protein